MDTATFLEKPLSHWLAPILVFIVLFGATPCSAQAQLARATTIRLSPDDAERGRYGGQERFFFLPPGKTGEDYQSAGFFGQKLRPYMGSNAEALAQLGKYSRQKTLYLVDKALLLGAAGVYASQVFAHGDAVYFNTTQQVAAGVAVVSLVATLFINQHTNEYLKQAVDTYNSDLTAKRNGALWHHLRPAQATVVATQKGQPLLTLRWQL